MPRVRQSIAVDSLGCRRLRQRRTESHQRLLAVHHRQHGSHLFQPLYRSGDEMTTLLVPPHVDPRPTDSRSRGELGSRAFSLIEVLLAIFILGVGVISIAALFPAGIAQQRASVDDIIGPTVANNALSLLRTKL